MAKGVTTATSNADRVKVGDYDSMITITLSNVEKNELTDVEWVRAYPINDPVVSKYVNIPDYRVFVVRMNCTDSFLFI